MVGSVPEMTTDVPIDSIRSEIAKFTAWLEQYGEVSFDHQSFFASDIGRWAKSTYYKNRWAGTAIVAPMIFCEALLPAARTLFWKPQRFPIADAHYAMGFAYLAKMSGKESDYKRAVHFLEVLEETRCPGYDEYCWGYPFDWETRDGTCKANTPLITTIPYVYEAFSQVYHLDKNPRWRQVMHSIAEHVLHCYSGSQTAEDAAACAYTPAPEDKGGVINASAYRAFLLTKAARDFADDRYWQIAKQNLNFVVSVQQPNGSWLYSVDSVRDFVDHFHTCFVLKALAKVEQLRPDSNCGAAIDKGIAYYVKHLFDEQGLPKPFSKPPRLTVYRRELYDYAECINLAALLMGRSKEFDRVTSLTVQDVLTRWRKADGSFRSRELFLGWDDVPMHRWAQAQLFRSLCLLLHRCQSGSSSVE